MPSFKLFVSLLCALVLGAVAAPAQAYAPLQTGIHDPDAAVGDPGEFDKISQTGSSLTRVTVSWSTVAPDVAEKPAGFDAKNPASPGYNWGGLDAFVRAAAARGLTPVVAVFHAPKFAEGDDAADRARRPDTAKPGSYHPNANEFRDFMTAMATRYSGSFSTPEGTLPAVRHYQMWNEPNFAEYVNASKREIPQYYVRLLNAGYDAVKAVSRSNLVLSAGLGPYGFNGAATDVDPQVFMREIFCLRGTGGRNLRTASCDTPKPKFDIWTQHPYSYGLKPTSKGQSPDAGAIGNMADIKRTLDYAVKKRRVAPRGKKALWATEFAWFSNPPGITAGDGRQLGVPLSRQAAYLSESVYRLWRNGFSAFVWYGLKDRSSFPSGLYFSDGQAKPALDAFKLPFYADQRGSRVLVWGYVKSDKRLRVRIEKRSGSRWKRVADVKTDSQGVFYRKIKGSKGTYRATVVSGSSKGLASYKFASR